VRFQLLALEFEITAEDDGLAPVLAYLTNGAVQDAAVTERMRYRVEGGGPYDVFENDTFLRTVDTRDMVLFVLYRAAYARLGDDRSRGGWLPIHGAVATVADRRMLVVGHKGAGKTTLMLRLLFDGHDVEGDELVFTRDGRAVPQPRQFHLKPGTDALIPELAGRLEHLPAAPTSEGDRITAFDPSSIGRWRIRGGPIEAAFVLKPGDARPATCRPLSTVDVVRHVIDHAFPAVESRPALLGACTALLREANGFELAGGDVERRAARLVHAVR
jgi:hypothetical protein